MKRTCGFLFLMLFALLLAGAPVFAGGDKNHGDVGQGEVDQGDIGGDVGSAPGDNAQGNQT
ncbi:MAG: hypothetical protein C0622_03155 [Desulfuromonas sp.]|nr:MAG: hypothetical protein C0622_03155 [Desulfuromonas sp.]